MDLKGKLPSIISNVLSERELSISVNSTYSDIHEQKMGLPQGTIISVTLFSIKVSVK